MQKKKINIRKINIIFVLILATVLITITVVSFARYISSTIWDYYLESNNFYFASSILDNSESMNNNWDGSAVSFDLVNYNSDNEVTSGNIEYTLFCEIIGDSTGNLKCGLNGTDQSTYYGILGDIEVCRNDTNDGEDVSTLNEETCNNRGYTWVEGNTSLNQTFSITSTDSSQEIDNVKVKITAKSTKPYTKTLTEEFNLIKSHNTSSGLIIEHESYADYEKLIVTNKTNENKILLAKWNPLEINISKSTYLDYKVDSSGNINEIEFSVDKDQTKTYIFYKNNSSSVIDVTDFTVVEKSINDNILVSNVEFVSNTYATQMEEPTFSNSTATFNTKITYPLGNVTYKVTITNNTPYQYRLKNIESVYSNKYYGFRLSDFTYGTIIEPNSSVELTITLSSTISNQQGITNLKFNFEDVLLTPEVKTVLTGAKSSTNAYVKTGFFPSSESRIVLDFSFLGPRGNSTWLFSSRRAYKNQMFGIAWNYSESLLQFNDVSYNFGSSGYKTNVRYNADISKDGLLLDGVSYANPADTPWQGIFEFYMFANNEANNVRGHTNGQAIIHEVKIYESGILVLDAIPVELTDGTIVFWDQVNENALETIGELIPYYEILP